jgi:hypothetical protein
MVTKVDSSFQHTQVNGAFVSSASEVRATAMMLILIVDVLGPYPHEG